MVEGEEKRGKESERERKKERRGEIDRE